jgi:methylthioribulose-1-phosphate dehydratase
MSQPTLAGLANQLTAVGRRFHARGWALGTSGNFSAVLSRDPVSLAITASSVHKGEMADAHVVEVDASGRIVRGEGSPSAETMLHVEIVRRVPSAGAVLHTHSIWGTILSAAGAHRDGFAIEGFEMLKGLGGVRTHEHREWIPIVDNDQDVSRLARAAGKAMEQHPQSHAFLIRRHGLYTWGETLTDAERHVEILEFLFETIGRTASFSASREEVYHGVVENS